jgi:hypothetical protein
VIGAEEQKAIADVCKRLFVDYARHVDFGDYEKFVELFCEDAVLDLGFKMQGQETIRRSMSKRSNELRSRHVLTNLAVDVHNKTKASGIAYLTLYRHIGPESLVDAAVPLRGVAGVGHYSNEFELTVQGWRIKSCKLNFAFQDPTHFPQP